MRGARGFARLFPWAAQVWSDEMRWILPLVFGIVGVAVLGSLGIWQMQRLAWKEGVIADIEAHIQADPIALPGEIKPAERYLPVEMTGRVGPEALRVLVSQKQVGAGYLVVSAFETREGRRVLLDRGFVRIEGAIPLGGEMRVVGNVHFPDERVSATPPNDEAKNIWFARDVMRMAEVLGTEPVLVVARRVEPGEAGIAPLPVDTTHIPNDHFGYAVQWFGLAVVWAAMTGYFLWRNRRTAKG